MLLAASLLVLTAAGCWLLLGAGARRAGRRGFVTLRPDRRAWLHGLRLAEPADFLRLEALVISGHPGRSVGRLVLGEGAEARTVYLKREGGTGWAVRLRNFLAGFGWVSRSVREARVLAGLERDGLPAPRWLATGEDGEGGAFLLVEEVAASTPLTAALRESPAPRRRELAQRLGALLARLHAAGFFHRDLYAKHVLVQATGSLFLLDWQRATRGAAAARGARVRDLACLHATLADDLAGPRDRLACLRAYLGPGVTRPALRRLAAEVEAMAARLWQRRHVREKRQGPGDGRQAWSVRDGEALALTPTLLEWVGDDALDWLDLRRQPLGPEPVSRRWIVLPGGRQALLVRRRGRLSLAAGTWRRLTGRAYRTPELRQSTLLWRLERHGVAAPRVLAVGQRWGEGRRIDSFLLTAPLAGTACLTTWLARAAPEGRRAVIAGLGEVLARLHEACCYLGDTAGRALAVRVEAAGPAPVLAHVEGMAPRRRPRPDLARADLRRLGALLSQAGAQEDDWRALLARYAAQAGGPRVTLPLPPPAPPPRRSWPAIGGLWRRLVAGERRIVQRRDWPEFVGCDWVDRVMDLEVTDRFSAKQGRSTGRLVLQPPDGTGRRLVVYLKRHYRLGAWSRWMAALWPGGDWSPAMQEHAHLEWARSQGVPVPATVAAGELIGPWGGLQSFLAVEELTDRLPLHEAVPLAAAALAPDDFRRWKRGLVVEMARLARLLHDRRHFHKDLYLCHFYVHRDDIVRPVAPAEWRGRVCLIDLHRLAHHPWTWWLWQLKDLAQLLYSSEVPGVDARDQAAFWAAYRGPGAGGWSVRLLQRLIRFKWRLYRNHNLRHKRRA